MPALVPMLVTANYNGENQDLFVLSDTPANAVTKMLAYYEIEKDEIDDLGVWNIGAMIVGGPTATDVLEWDEKFYTAIK